jgi:hypothetical protein
MCVENIGHPRFRAAYFCSSPHVPLLNIQGGFYISYLLRNPVPLYYRTDSSPRPPFRGPPRPPPRCICPA